MHNKILLNSYHFIDNLNIKNISNLQKSVCIIYRNYNSKVNLNELMMFKKICKKLKRKFIISSRAKFSKT